MAALLVAVVLLFSCGALLLYVEHGGADKWLRGAMIHRMEEFTGGRVELGGFHLRLWGIRAELDDFTLHGSEPAGVAPFFHADKAEVRLHILSFVGRQVAIDELRAQKPQVNIRVDRDGATNIPSPETRRTVRPWREQLMDLRIGALELADGSVTFNDVRKSLEVTATSVVFTLNFAAQPVGTDAYAGVLDAKEVRTAYRRDLPFSAVLHAKFVLGRNSFSLGEFSYRLPRSELNLTADVPDLAHPAVNLHYRGRLSLDDLGQVLRNRYVPGGLVEFSGGGEWAGSAVKMSGYYQASGISFPYRWFHARDITTAGRFEAGSEKLDLTEFEIRALGGQIDGRMTLDYKNLAFRAESHEHGASLASILDAVNNPDLPIDSLRWTATVNVDAVNTWNGGFEHFETRGETTWLPPGSLLPGQIPASARIDFDYSVDTNQMLLPQGEISTPDTQLTMAGMLGEKDSALETILNTRDLTDFDDFINLIRGPDAEPKRIEGQGEWHGRILGPLSGPTFSGHVQVLHARYDALYWDRIAGQLDYSPDGLKLTRTTTQVGDSSIQFDLQLLFDGDWSFLPSSRWSLDAHADRTPMDGLQDMFETHYPVHGLLSGDFHGGGSRSTPRFMATFSADQLSAYGILLGKMDARLSFDEDEVRLDHAILRKGTGRVTGGFAYRFSEHSAQFDLQGTGLPLENIQHIQSASLPIAGIMDFGVRGEGPLTALSGSGGLNVRGFHSGNEIQGDFGATIRSDGRQAHLMLHSSPEGRLAGELVIGLGAGFPISGTLNTTRLDLDPLINSRLHLGGLTGHSSVDGEFSLSGMLADPHSLVVNATLPRLSVEYEHVHLENNGVLKLSYSQDEVRVEQANLRGPDSDFQLEGRAHFTGDRAMNLKVDGTINLQLASSFFPRLDALGHAVVSIQGNGTLDAPRISGRLRVQGASAHYGDFPVGLSQVNGDLVFDRDRLIFDGLTAESGGGKLTLGGSLAYGPGPSRYEVSCKAVGVRIRYPAGLSWLANADLRLDGDTQAALLSGTVVVDRLLFSEGADPLVALSSSQTSAGIGGPSSPFLQNLQFNIAVSTASGAQMKWTGARLDLDSDLRVRGTFDHPIILGNVHVLNGELNYRGTLYLISRGDVNFSNPFRLDPILNVEATTSIQQYQVTLDFSGPASHASLSYRSDPPLPTADIIGLLALGSTTGSSTLRTTGSTQTQDYGASALLSEAVSSQLGGRIERLFGISRFRVDPFLAGTATAQSAAARVTIEQQVTHDLTVTYSTNTSGDQEQVIQVEYAVTPNISIVGLRDLNGLFALDIKFTKRFR
jgi:translocation and assembly module TamB